MAGGPGGLLRSDGRLWVAAGLHVQHLPEAFERLQNMGGGYYRVVNVWNGLALQTDGQSPATVTLATPSADTHQQWQLSFQAIYPKKGVAGNEANAAMFGASWDYNWSRTPNLPSPAQVVFLPEQWNGAGQDTTPQYAPGWHTDPKPIDRKSTR